MGRWKYFKTLNRYGWPIALDTAPVPNGLGAKQKGNRRPILYDLDNDPGENYNVIGTYPDMAARLKAAMRAWEKKTSKNPRGFGAA